MRRLQTNCYWLVVLLTVSCGDPSGETEIPAAVGIYAPQGAILPDATETQRATFMRGEDIVRKRFTPDDGLGPIFNVTFCGACHEKPVFGGAAGHYRDFILHGQTTSDGSFIPSGDRSGILSSYRWPIDTKRPAPDATANTAAIRNPIPFFGIGLLAEIPEESILQHADPDDADGDGISGRPNYDRGFVGRFGTKSQTVSVEGFIRGPIFNHIGITTDPLSADAKAKLPVPSVLDEDDSRVATVNSPLEIQRFHQAAAPSEPLTDDDDIPDPEMDEDTLFALVSWAMLLAVPPPDEPTELTEAGLEEFESIGCASCHVPGLEGPRGMIFPYSDLLLHDMGPELADGISMGIATGSEFRTAPLWGITSVGPYLHDGRADTLDEAISLHGGEAERSRDRYLALEPSKKQSIIAFLESLGGASQKTAGLIPPNTPIAAVGELGGPLYPLADAEKDQFLAGRHLFDRDVYLREGLGPYFSGDSCRGCHFEPVVGGAGPLGVNGTRFGSYDENGDFVTPAGGTVLAKLATTGHSRPEATAAMFTESRQTPTVLGAGILDRVSPEAILANADPMDTDGDGISGRGHIFVDGRLGRFGWKAQIPSLIEFVRDAVSVELGLTVPSLVLLDDDGRDITPEYTFGTATDSDAVPDPEVDAVTLDNLVFYIGQLAPHQPKKDVPSGRRLFEFIGCAQCHIPTLVGMEGSVPAYTDLLLNDVLGDAKQAVPDGEAMPGEYRTPPLWGLSDTAPYMHDGSATTIHQAILEHAGEAQGTVDRYRALSEAERAPLLEFLDSL
ncbi:MAG: di-heme oxidoredictase family protein [Myxococcota bacterium]|nr:di-heme oxidoredictase family protein [Myxococcota bacterium]